LQRSSSHLGGRRRLNAEARAGRHLQLQRFAERHRRVESVGRRSVPLEQGRVAFEGRGVVCDTQVGTDFAPAKRSRAKPIKRKKNITKKRSPSRKKKHTSF
jgi:hypothetical protein